MSETNLFYEEELASQKGAAKALAEHPLPFLPDTKVQFAWDSTSLGWLKTCPRLYQYSMIEGWRARGTGVHLKFGQLYHSALEQYDKLRTLGEDHETTLREVVRETLVSTWDSEAGVWVSDHPSKNRETLVRSVIWYLDNFKDDPAKTLILANGKPAVELSFRMDFDWRGIVLCGHLDRVVDFGGQKYVMDRKTTGSSPTPHYFDGFSPDNQMSIYTLAARVQFSTPVAGVIIDAAQIAVGFTRFQRGFTYRTEVQLEEWRKDAKFWFAQAEEFADEGFWPMNDKSCNLYGGCAFRKVCSKSPEVRDRFLESDFERRPWNPLESR